MQYIFDTGFFMVISLTKGVKNGCSFPSKFDFVSILLLKHLDIFKSHFCESWHSQSSGDLLKDWSWLSLNLLKSLLQVVKESIFRFQHLLDRRLVFDVSLRDVRVNLLGKNEGVVFVKSLTRLSDDVSHHRVEPLALARQLLQPVCLLTDHLGAQTLPAFSPVSHSIGQRVTLCQFCWCGRSHGGGPARRGQVLGEGSVQRKWHSQLLHRGRGHLLLENGCYSRCWLHVCGWHGDRCRLRAAGKGRRLISAALPSKRQPPCPVDIRKAIRGHYQSWYIVYVYWLCCNMKIQFMFQLKAIEP